MERGRLVPRYYSGMRRLASIGILLSGLGGAAFTSAATAQTELPNIKRLKDGEPRPAAKASELDWLVGQWKGTGLGGECEESWLPAVGGALVGTFRLSKQGEPSFYEFLAIVEEEGSLTFHVKHFNPDISGWEEKDESMKFRLVELGERVAYFDGLTLRRTGDSLDIYLAMRGRDGAREEAMHFTRVQTPSTTTN